MLSHFLHVIRKGTFVVLDTETTGLQHPAEICQLALISATGSVWIDTLIKPTRPIPPAATAIHGITDDLVEESPTWKDIQPFVFEAITGLDVVVYNAAYDRKLMHWSDEANGLPHFEYKTENTHWYCAMEAYAEYNGEIDPYYGSYKWKALSVAMTLSGLPLRTAHTALSDAQMTLDLVKYMAAHPK